MSGIECIVPDWAAPEQVRAVCTTRQGGISRPPYDSLNLSARAGDDVQAVAENRRRLAQALDLPAEPLWLKQVHGSRLVQAYPPRLAARGDPPWRGGLDPEADASWSDQPGAVCVLLTADCLPLLLCDGSGAWVAALHCGWRGLAGGIIESVLQELPGDSSGRLAWLGPAIGSDAFEVGEAVREEFVKVDRAPESAFREAAEPGQFYCDMYAVARHQLAATGVNQIAGGGFCTATDQERFFSYRRDGDTGRMATLIWLSSSV